MRAILIAAIALIVLAVPAMAQQQAHIYPTGPCRGVPGMKCAQVNVGNPYGRQRPNVRMPGTSQMVNGRYRNIVHNNRNGTIIGAIGTGMAVGVMAGGHHHRHHATGYNGGVLPVERPIGVPTVTGPVATPTGQPYMGSRVEIVENGISYTGKGCRRADGEDGREGFGPGGGLGCWRF